MSKLKKLLKDKISEGKVLELGSEEHDLKGEILEEIKSIMSDGMAEKLRGMKKVTIAAPTTEGLKEGIEKAGEVVDETDMGEDMDGELIEGEILGEECGMEIMDEDEVLKKLKKLAEDKE